LLVTTHSFSTSGLGLLYIFGGDNLLTIDQLRVAFCIALVNIARTPKLVPVIHKHFDFSVWMKEKLLPNADLRSVKLFYLLIFKARIGIE
jgi:hypothetical protein